jgi:Tol biopolymer transport system component
MLDTETEFDRKLRALYDHIQSQDPPASLALIKAPAIRSDRRVLGRFAGVAGFAVIAAGIALFATELNAHHVSTPPQQSTHTVTPPRPVWAPSPLPSPNPRLALPSLPNRTWLPTSVRVLVPETRGTGGASVTIVPDGELYIQYACVGDGALVVTATDVLGPERRPGCSSSVAHVTVVGTSLPAYPNQVLKASDLGKPVTIEISTAPSTTWEIFVAESGPPMATQGWIAVSALPWTAMIGEHGDIYLLSEGASPRRIIGSDGDGIAQDCPTFSPDGLRLAYGEARASGATNNDRGVWPVSDRAVVVVGVNADGDPSQPLMRVTLPTSPGEIACPEWSPDGRYVAYRVGADLWVADTTTGTTNLFPVLATPWGENAFAWSRDGSRIAVAEPGQIRLVPIDGSTPTVISAFGGVPGSYTGSMGWTAGDAGIVYVGTDPQGYGPAVNRVDANGTNDTELGCGSDAVISPDGARVAYISCPFPDQPNDQHVITMPTRGGKGVEVTAPPNFMIEGLLWSPDGKRLLLGSIDGVVSVAVAPGSAPVVYATGQSDYPGAGLDLEWSSSELTWQPVTGPSR